MREAIRDLDFEGQPYEAVARLYAANEAADAVLEKVDGWDARRTTGVDTLTHCRCGRQWGYEAGVPAICYDCDRLRPPGLT